MIVPSCIPILFAASSSWIFSTRWTSRKWFPDPKLPSCGSPRFLALSDTLFGSAFAICPFSSQTFASSLVPYPLSIAHETPLTKTSSNSDWVNLTAPLEPTPDGIDLKRSFTSSASFGRTCSSVRFVRSNLTPQLIS